ncbi:hypothetical protein ACIOWE_02805 [Pseudomonas sp. NPDC087598]|uniref:hypothetical protein n=1 Tax=Pseudomonas sp. NPDC087598 TaxID=3364440 RepID=UPI00382DB761
MERILAEREVGDSCADTQSLLAKAIEAKVLNVENSRSKDRSLRQLLHRKSRFTVRVAAGCDLLLEQKKPPLRAAKSASTLIQKPRLKLMVIA